MGKNKDYTEKEHFVPVSYLTGFSDDNIYVWYYDLRDLAKDPKPVPIESICYRKDLYEVKDENGSYFQRNLIEKCLMGLEGQFTTKRHKLEQKLIKENFGKACFFTEEEKVFWKTYIAVQMLRTPSVIKNGEGEIAKTINYKDAGEMAKYITISHCLPFDITIPNRENTFFMRIISILDKMSIRLGVDYEERIITSDNPIYCYAPGFDIDSCERILFPVSSKMIIELCSDAEIGQKNTVFELSREHLIDVYNTITYSAHNSVYTRKRIPKEYLDIVNSARKDKEIDIEKGYYQWIYGMK